MLTRSTYHAIAHELLKAGNQRQTTALFRKRCPHIVRQIQQDSRQRGPLSFWGRSTNEDELAHDLIVAPRILMSIGQLMNRQLLPATPHAGLQHTYGYLFSILRTQYGYKRDRWFDSELANVLNVPHHTLRPDPSTSTLLHNVTWLTGQIAFRGHSERRRLTDYLHGKIDPALRNWTPRELTISRLEETAKLTSRNHRAFQVRLRTDLVASSSNRPNSVVLIYSYLDSRIKAPRLITVFCVGTSSSSALLARGSMKGSIEIRPRYNAFIPGFQEPVPGTVSCRR